MLISYISFQSSISCILKTSENILCILQFQLPPSPPPAPKTEGGGWKIIRDEFLAWESLHSTDHSPSACMEFEWAPTAILKLYGTETSLISEFPQTKELLKMLPFTSYSFYTLNPRTELFPHRGITSFLLRYHLGIIVPTYDVSSSSLSNSNVKNPHLSLCSSERFSSNSSPDDYSLYCDEYNHYNWKEGMDFVFDDNSIHTAHNPGNERRVILLADFVRPNIGFKIFGYSIGKFVIDNLVIHGLRRTEEVNKYAKAFDTHYEQLRREVKGGEGSRSKGCVFHMLNMVDQWNVKK